MTYRDRREARAERLREWAAKREAKAEANFAAADQLAGMIPFGQPILVGHHSERHARRDQERIYSGMSKGCENRNKAKEMASKADNIEAAADHAIYSDDPDAVERLVERIADLEAERARYKAHNQAARKAGTATMPSYVLSNLGGNIGRLRKRLESLTEREWKCTTESRSR